MACEFDDAAPVAAETLHGTAPGNPAGDTFSAWQGEHLLGVVATSGKWIRLLAVHPSARERGVGTVLLAGAESSIARRHEPLARTLDQPGNYLAPGIDTRNELALSWLERRGWSRKAINTNLLVDVATNPRVTSARRDDAASRCLQDGYEIRRARRDEKPALIASIRQAFSDTWAFEVARALAHTPAGVHLAMHRASNDIAAFAAHDGNNQGLGWFGPAGTMESHRRRGLGEALLLACLMDVADAGHDTCTIAWIGPRAFYERCAGISGERTFVVMTKQMETK